MPEKNLRNLEALSDLEIQLKATYNINTALSGLLDDILLKGKLDIDDITISTSILCFTGLDFSLSCNSAHLYIAGF